MSDDNSRHTKWPVCHGLYVAAEAKSQSELPSSTGSAGATEFEAGRWRGMTDAAEIAGALAPRDMECAPSQNDYYQMGRDAAKRDILAARDVAAQPNADLKHSRYFMDTKTETEAAPAPAPAVASKELLGENEYRKHPIYGTDFSKRLSRLVEDVRNEITEARGHLTDISLGYPGWKERVEHVGGLLTCGLVALHVSNEEIIKWEIARDDNERGKSLCFRPRGIGLDVVPCCFVCGATNRSAGANGYLNNIAAFTDSKETGEEIVAWFDGRARLDFRPSEPRWIQVKVGACDLHLPNLERLQALTGAYGLLRKLDITEAISPNQ